MTNEFIDFGWRIKRTGLTQAEFAERAAVSTNTLSTLINCKNDNPQKRTLDKIRKTLQDLEDSTIAVGVHPEDETNTINPLLRG